MIKMVYDSVTGLAIPDGIAMQRAKLIAISSSQSDGQMFFSTENIFQAVRILVKRGLIKKEDIVFVFNDVEMRIDNDGRVENWQDGFCDTIDRFNEILLRS